MTGEKFAEIVTKRANERVNAKIKAFTDALYKAFRDLTGEIYISKAQGSKRLANYHILERMVAEESISFNKGWPKMLWEQEEEKVSAELLSMMDEMQKALLSPGPQKGDCTAAAEKVKAEE